MHIYFEMETEWISDATSFFFFFFFEQILMLQVKRKLKKHGPIVLMNWAVTFQVLMAQTNVSLHSLSPTGPPTV
jgi:hypothetical protein